MKNQTFSRVIALLPLICMPLAGHSQTTRRGDDDHSLVTVTFTFKSAATGCIGYQNNEGGTRFYIEFRTSNKPSTLVSDIEASVEIRKEKDKSTNEVTVYSIPFDPGTPPRFGPGSSPNEMILIFRPLQDPSQANTNKITNKSRLATPTESALGDIGRTPKMDAFATSQPSTATLSPILPDVSQPDEPAMMGSTPVFGGQTTQPSSSSLIQNERHLFDEVKEKLNLANIDLSVPESPAFTVLGLTPHTVTRPTSPRQLASSLLNGIDQRGNFQSGIALDFSPYLTYAGDHLTLQSYRQSYGLRLLTRMQISFATTKGASDDDKSLRLAAGFHLTLMDLGDPHSDAELMKCFADKLTLPLPPKTVPPIEPDSTAPQVEKVKYALQLKEFNDAMAKYEDARKAASQKNVVAAEQCREEARKRNWNRSSWIVAAAPTWISTTGETGDYGYDGGGVWSSIAYGFEHVPGLEKTSQLIFHARYRNKEIVPEPAMEGKFFRQDSFFLGGRLRAGTENSTASFEGVFQRQRRIGMQFENSSRLAFGIERKIAENIWFQLAFGGQNDTPDGKKKGFVLSTFKWGFSQKRDFVTPNQ